MRKTYLKLELAALLVAILAVLIVGNHALGRVEAQTQIAERV